MLLKPGLILSQAATRQLSNLASRAYPREGCGFLLGIRHSQHSVIHFVASGRNRSQALDRFVLDPGDLVAADNLARQAGLELLGFWHSHPDAAALPSDADRAAAWSAMSNLIVPVDDGVPGSPRSWQLVDGVMLEESTG